MIIIYKTINIYIICSKRGVLKRCAQLRPDERSHVGGCAQVLERQNDADVEPG